LLITEDTNIASGVAAVAEERHQPAYPWRGRAARQIERQRGIRAASKEECSSSTTSYTLPLLPLYHPSSFSPSTMRLCYLMAAMASLVVSPALSTPALQASTSADVGIALHRPVAPRMKYENLNHIIIRMTNAVETLDSAISTAISSQKIQDSLAPAEKGLGLLAMYLQDATDGLNNGSVKINNPEQVYGSLTKLKDAIKPVAEKTASIKSSLDQLEFTGIIVTVLQSLTVGLDGFYHALDARL
jgi:hypothetical protein